MIFGNFINKLLLFIVIKSTVQSVLESRCFICFGFCVFCSLISLYACYSVLVHYVATERQFERSSLVESQRIELLNCFHFSYWHLNAIIISHYSIKSTGTNSFTSISTSVETSCRFRFFLCSAFAKNFLRMAFRQTFQNSIGNVNFWRARHFIAFRSLSWSSNRQFSISLFDRDFTTKSRFVVFLCMFEPQTRACARQNKIQAKQIKLLLFFAFDSMKSNGLQLSTLCTFAAVISF